jgi:diguanylate cyclase (GGDEF)-like protein
MQSEARTTRGILIGVVLTLGIIAGREALPLRTVDLTARHHYLSTLADPALADRVQWVDEQHLRFRCNYRAEDRFAYQPCSLSFVLTEPGRDAKGLDLSRFHSITLDLSYRGSSDFVRLGVRNFDPRFSRLQDANSARMQSVELRARDVSVPLTIGLSELTVPEWWIANYNLPREFNIGRLDNAVSVMVDLPADLKGKVQELQVRRIAVQGDWIGRDMLYLAVLGAWVAAALTFVVRHMVHLRAAHDRLHRLVRIDPLTGLLNRRGGEEQLDELAAEKRPFVLLVIDLDHFKRINDTHGHAAGDEVLRRTAMVISHCVRGGDVVARWGGEEMIVACVDCPPDQGVRIAQKVRRKLETSSFGRLRRIAVTASIGVAAATPGEAFSTVFARADAALYRAKAGGRNRVVLDDGSAEDPPQAAQA